MLVLTRRTGEKILLGDDIRLTVAAVHGGKVRLAVSAPADIRIRRAELTPVPDPVAASTDLIPLAN